MEASRKEKDLTEVRLEAGLLDVFGLPQTIKDVAQRLEISEQVARALVEHGLRSFSDDPEEPEELSSSS
jgi:hypothetical protein